MKRLFNVLIILCVLSVVSAIIGSVLSSCSTESENKEQLKSDESILAFKDELQSFCMTGITPSCEEATRWIALDSSNIISVTFPNTNKEEAKKLVDNIKSVGDFLILMSEHDANINVGDMNTWDDNVGTTISVAIPQSQMKSSMLPLVNKSKEYLMNRGMTQSEIQEMLVDANADECTLIPLVLAMAEYEGNNNMSNVTMPSNNYGLFITTAHAEIDWGLVKNCAIKALDLNIFQILWQSNTKKWSKAIIKRLFKTIAAKSCTPVFAFCTVLVFADCMNGSNLL